MFSSGNINQGCTWISFTSFGVDSTPCSKLSQPKLLLINTQNNLQYPLLVPPYSGINDYPGVSPISFNSVLWQVIFAEERFHGVSNISFAIKLARPSLVFNQDAIVTLYGGEVSRISLRMKNIQHTIRGFIFSPWSLLFAGNLKYANGLQSYLLSRDHNNLKAEFQAGKGTVSAVNRCTHGCC